MIFTPAQIGCDVSFYQDDDATPQKIDFNKMQQAGSSFVFLRGGQNTWVDEDFRDYINAVKLTTMQWGTYWFYDSRDTPQNQVTRWRNVCGTDIPAVVALDLEEQYNGAYKGERYWKEALEACKVQFAQSRIIIYSANWWWEQQTVTDPAYFASYPLWVAGYTSSPANVKLPKPWYDRNIQAHIWQYTSSGNGALYGAESAEIDLSYFNAFYNYNDFWKITVNPTPPINLPASFDVVMDAKDETGKIIKTYKGTLS